MAECGFALIEEGASTPLSPEGLVEVFCAPGSGRGLRAAAATVPGVVLISDLAVLPPVAAARSPGDFAELAATAWLELRSLDRARLLALRWRTANGGAGAMSAPPCALEAWHGDVGGSASSRTPPMARLRGIASVNGMATGRLVLKPSLLKAFEAKPGNPIAVYPVGSLLNHSCMPTTNRLPVGQHLVVRATRRVAPGDELTCTYIEVRAPVAVRRAELESSWGFECNCARCIFEAEVWREAGPQIEKLAKTVWRRFERLRSGGVCGEAELQELVAEAEALTEDALNAFLDGAATSSGSVDDKDVPPLLGMRRAAVQLSRETRARLFTAAHADTCADSTPVATGPPLADTLDGACAFLKLRDLLLVSLWLAPAWELAFGLQQAKRSREAAALWARVARVTAAALPLSTSHATAAMEAALGAAEFVEFRAVAEDERLRSLLRESIEICDGVYGGGSAMWRRLVTARLESFDAPLSSFISAVLDSLAAPRTGVRFLGSPWREGWLPTWSEQTATPTAQPSASAPDARVCLTARPPTVVEELGGDGGQRRRLCVVEVAGVEDPAHAHVDLSAWVARVEIRPNGGDSVVAASVKVTLPEAVIVGDATTSWSRRNKALKIRAPIMSNVALDSNFYGCGS